MGELANAYKYLRISTHAPAGGATTLLGVLAHPATISTHAPAGGATRKEPKKPRPDLISTHAPAGGATLGCAPRPGGVLISTHAPAGGATFPEHLRCRASADFYSRPCGRGDERSSVLGNAGRAFLLTPLREGRPAQGAERETDFIISTHAPAGGATHGRRKPIGPSHFYSRPCGRGDLPAMCQPRRA